MAVSRRNVQKCWLEKCIPSKAQPTPCPEVGNCSFSSPHQGGGSSLPSVQFSAVFSEDQGKLQCSPLCLLPALQRPQQELSSSLPRAWLCSKVLCCPPQTPHSAAAGQMFSFRLYSSRGRVGLTSDACTDLLFHLVFPPLLLLVCGEALAPHHHILTLWGFRAGSPASRHQTCSGVIYFSKYRIS